jgi:hypothetical protein
MSQEKLILMNQLVIMKSQLYQLTHEGLFGEAYRLLKEQIMMTETALACSG